MEIIEQLMRAELEAIIDYPYEDEFRKYDIKNLIRNLKEYRKVRIRKEMKEENTTGGTSQ